MAVFVLETCVKIRVTLPIPAESSALVSGIYIALNNANLKPWEIYRDHNILKLL